mmetsp:Transcript_29271/g.95395  ORF Transcript_29271/g.95395 Transcript_29271/m.95395 type:complete len:281 (-) Transcript_29271:468-1310(-)
MSALTPMEGRKRVRSARTKPTGKKTPDAGRYVHAVSARRSTLASLTAIPPVVLLSNAAALRAEPLAGARKAGSSLVSANAITAPRRRDHAFRTSLSSVTGPRLPPESTNGTVPPEWSEHIDPCGYTRSTAAAAAICRRESARCARAISRASTGHSRASQARPMIGPAPPIARTRNPRRQAPPNASTMILTTTAPRCPSPPRTAKEHASRTRHTARPIAPCSLHKSARPVVPITPESASAAPATVRTRVAHECTASVATNQMADKSSARPTTLATASTCTG